ncbi:MAG: sensor histidine kinase [Sedimentisphaerales bacterium]|nr:sensor histidine kinase [Sedimentisphaerales bacterium]
MDSLKEKLIWQELKVSRGCKFLSIIILLIICCGFSLYYHMVMKICTVATHLFYIPIVISAIWWKRKGLIIPLFLGFFLIVSHHVFIHDIAPSPDYLRVIMFLTVGIITVILREQLALAERTMAREREKLRYLTHRLSKSEEIHKMQIAAGLHDSVGPQLSAAKIMLHTHKTKSGKENTYLFDKVIDCIDTSIVEIREMIFELSPKVLYELGLEAAVESLIESYKKKTSLNFRYECSEHSFNLNKNSRSILFRAIRELLLNIDKHAQAQNVYIKIENMQEKLTITIEDDGIGFNAPKTLMNEKYVDCFGLFSIRQQLLDINGYLFIESNIGSGTKVTLTCPITSNENNERDNKHDDKHSYSRKSYCNV